MNQQQQNNNERNASNSNNLQGLNKNNLENMLSDNIVLGNWLNGMKANNMNLYENIKNQNSSNNN